jgi:molybdopterin-guanine dinucleotide biosynthesis protein A
MGGVKALRPFRGAPLAAHALALARGWSEQVVAVVRDPAQAGGALDASLVLDRAGVAGPLAGLAGSLAHAACVGADQVLTIPCDMPRLPPDLPERLTAALGPKAEVALPAVLGALQPACGLWRVRALERLDAYVAAGGSSLRGFADACGVTIVHFAPAEAPCFANANTLEELERMERDMP